MGGMASGSLQDTLQQRRTQLLSDLNRIEKKLFEQESDYFMSDSSLLGNALRGYDGFLSSKDTQRRRQRSFRPEDRLFSLSSMSSDVSKELEPPGNEAQEGGPEWVRSHRAGGGWVKAEENTGGNRRRKK